MSETQTGREPGAQTMKCYPFATIEPKWQRYWEENRTFRAVDFSPKPKFYCADMFPYPSGEGLHVGHPEGYTATDIVSRYKRMKGFNVLHPMGWDAFGLPAERYAVKTGVHPAITTAKNIDTFRRQLKMLGFSYDWEREVNTTDPDYYRWTQWIFLKLHERGLAYVAEIPVNWCPDLGTVLADEEVVEGRSVEGDHPVIRRPMRQWVLKITAYADRLLEGLDTIDWPHSTREMQRNWIGRSIGAEIDFALDGAAGAIRVFTTRPDTVFGATYMVLAPEHPLVGRVTSAEHAAEVRAYQDAAARKSDLQRVELAKEKTGVFTGGYAINPATQGRIPIWIADYVLMGYGTGAIMAVPGHDERDWEFARSFGLPIVEVVAGGDVESGPYVDKVNGRSANSTTPDGRFTLNGMTFDQAFEAITAWLEAKGYGRRAINYRLRDWLFSRQRFWGEPFPIIWVDGQPRALPEQYLPIRLPEVARYQPSGTGESPLATIDEWVNTTDPSSGKPARRETNTMPQWAGSCWYYLRYLDPHNDRAPFDPAKEKYWMPVDLYIGGAEHGVLHLLYARFWHKVLYDCGLVHTEEPFMKLVHQGTILGEDNVKMSKSRGNVVNPDDVVAQYGADAMRLYEMFMGPLEVVKPWSTKGVDGVSRFLDRVWRVVVGEDGAPSRALTTDPADPELERVLHRTIKKVTEGIEGLRLNTAIAQMMVLTNELTRRERRSRAVIEPFVLILSPFAPHLCEELWQRLGHATTLAFEPWPSFDPSLTVDDVATVAVQVNGKLRGTLSLPLGTSQDDARAAAVAEPSVARHLDGLEIRKVIYVPDRLINLVVARP